ACTAQLDDQKITLPIVNPNLRVGQYVPGRCVPEFQAAGVNVPAQITEAIITFEIEMDDGVSRREVSRVPIVVVGS
ncbi:MAG: hypothetical protein AAB369_02060, partial [Chloroflexota bacterium]